MFKQKQSRNARIGIAAGVGVALIAVGAARGLVQAEPDVPTLVVGRDFPLRDASREAQYVVCPWRQPDADIARFFPAVAQSAIARDETLVFTRQRPLLTRLLGRAPTGAENALLIHRILLRTPVSGKVVISAAVTDGRKERQTSAHDGLHTSKGETYAGAIMTRYVRGASGVIELVLAVDARERVIGAGIQRLREPENVARELQSPRFLGSFQGKTYASAWTLAPSAASGSAAPGSASASAGTYDAFSVSARAILDEAHVALVLLHVGEQTLAHP